MYSYAQALPNSLRVLEAFRVPAGVMTQLTLLESLSLDSMFSIEGQPACSLSFLQRLTCLHLNYALDEDLWAIAGLHWLAHPLPEPCVLAPVTNVCCMAAAL